MKIEQKQNPGGDTDMEAAAKVFEQVLESILGDRASVALVSIAPSSVDKSGNQRTTAGPLPQLTHRVRERIMRDALVTEYCEELNNDMLLLACAVETLESVFKQMLEGTMPVKTAKTLFSDVADMQNGIVQKWLAFYSEET